MTEKLHIEDAQLRELMHMMSHDLRNPLAAIVTNLEFAKRLVQQPGVDPDLADSIADSVTACDVLRRIVSNMDVLVRGATMHVTLVELDVRTVVDDVVASCRERAVQAGLTLVPAGGGAAIRALLDRSMFSLAVENLLENAIQHAPRRSTITLAVESDGAIARVHVRDDGAAVPPELRVRAVSVAAHTPTGRLEMSRYGRGLGLLAAQAAAAATGCTLVLGGDESSCLTLELPLIPG